MILQMLLLQRTLSPLANIKGFTRDLYYFNQGQKLKRKYMLQLSKLEKPVYCYDPVIKNEGAESVEEMNDWETHTEGAI